jgi:ATP-dependent DNA helicase RecG
MRGDDTIKDPIDSLKGVGPSLASKFAVLGIRTLADLIDYYPRRYDDYSTVTPIVKLKPGAVTIRAVVKQAKGRYVRRGMHVTEAVASDETSSVRMVWFNQPYRAAALKPGAEYFISGNFELNHQRLSIMNPSVELVSDFPTQTARILAVYRETKGLKSNQIRSAVKQVLPVIDGLEETLPQWLVEAGKFMGRAEAIRTMHVPDSAEALEAARRRLGFEEVFVLTLAALRNKYQLNIEQAPQVLFDESVAKDFVSHLPFKLTDAQRKVCWQIFTDMGKTRPMNRLVEGDVGSGKTVVAAMAAVMVLHGGHQVAFMAPTELLARQHADTIYKLMQPLGYESQVGLLVGGLSAVQKRRMHGHIADGTVRFIVGTHALIQDKVDMSKLELVIIDEQHRFGVDQRRKLQIKAGHMPHVLSLTATPIPRSLALTLYGELDISVIDVKPAGRSPVITQIVSPNSRAQLNAKLETELAAGRQIFVVCPLISAQDTDVYGGEAEVAGGVTVQADARRSAEEVFKQLSEKDFKHRRVGLLHGKMKPEEKNAVMQRFVAHELDILVSTTVIEVGVDVPNASVMLIENAERFGLAQIHQLRGRVGRGGHQGYCYLMTADSKSPSRRLRALESSSDGFKLAELDLEIRGPGAIYGTMQHGDLDLRIATLTDVRLIAEARSAAQKFIDRGEDLIQYPYLSKQVTRLSAVTNLN